MGKYKRLEKLVQGRFSATGADGITAAFVFHSAHHAGYFAEAEGDGKVIGKTRIERLAQDVAKILESLKGQKRPSAVSAGAEACAAPEATPVRPQVDQQLLSLFDEEE